MPSVSTPKAYKLSFAIFYSFPFGKNNSILEVITCIPYNEMPSCLPMVGYSWGVVPDHNISCLY